MARESRKGKPHHRDRKQRKRQNANKISYHFGKRDFSCQCGECNYAFKVSLGLVGALELLRAKANNRINILKAYECPVSKEKSGSLKRNLYCLGIAADITIDNLDIQKVYQLAEEIEEFNGIGLNVTENYVYVDTRKDDTESRWIEKNGVQTELTEDNRDQYFAAAP